MTFSGVWWAPKGPLAHRSGSAWRTCPRVSWWPLTSGSSMWMQEMTEREGRFGRCSPSPWDQLFNTPARSQLPSPEREQLGIRDLPHSLGLDNDRIFWICLFYGNSGQGMMRLIEWNKWGQETNPLNQGPSVYVHPLCPSVHGAAGSLSPTGARPSGLQFPAPELPAYMTLGWNLLPALFPSLSFVQWK